MNTLTKGFAKRALSILLVTIMVFSLGIVGITSVSASEQEFAETGGSNVYNGTVIYDNTLTQWDNSYMYFVYGSSSWSKVIKLTNIPDSNLYYSDSLSEWTGSGVTYFGVVSTTSEWTENSWSSDNLKNAAGYTAAYTSTFNFNSGDMNLITPNSKNNGTTISIVTQTNGYKDLNHPQNAYACVDSGDTYVTGSAGGTVKISGYGLNSDHKGTTAGSTTAASSASFNACRGSEVTLTAEAKSGYTFIGWTQSLTTLSIESESPEIKYTSQEGKTYYALFKKDITHSVTLSLSNSSFDIETGESFNVSGTGYVDDNTTAYEITYTLYASTDGTTKGDVVDFDTNSNGVFDFTVPAHDTEGTYYYIVEASATVDPEPLTTEKTVTVTVTEPEIILPTFEIDVKASTRYIGANLVITATPVTNTVKPSSVTYTLTTDIEGYESIVNNTGKFEIPGTVTDLFENGSTYTFTVSAVATYAGTEFADITDEGSVSVTFEENTGSTDVTIYFKSSISYGYQPNISLDGGTTFEKMSYASFISKNDTQSASYAWYSYSTTVLNSEAYNIVIKGNRDYFYTGKYTLDMLNETDFDSTSGTAIYLALDNLNVSAPTTMQNISTSANRDWVSTATHMIIPNDTSAEPSLAGVSYNAVSVGDANCDGKVNIKDATYVQKSLAKVVEASELSTQVSDVNQDGSVTIKDATAIQKQLANL